MVFVVLMLDIHHHPFSRHGQKRLLLALLNLAIVVEIEFSRLALRLQLSLSNQVFNPGGDNFIERIVVMRAQPAQYMGYFN